MRAYNNEYDSPDDDRRTIPARYDQTAWAVSEPNWGEPRIIAETVRDSYPDTFAVFLKMKEYGLYTGATEFPLPNGKSGDWFRAYEQGFRLVKLEFNQHNVEVIRK